MLGPAFVLGLMASPAQAREVRIVLPDGWVADDLRGPHIGFSEGGRGRVRHLQVDEQGLQQLEALGLSWTAVPTPPPEVPSGYHSAAAAVASLQRLSEEHPDRARLVELGQSRSRRPIYALRIANTDHPAVVLRVLAAHHGDEPISAELALDLAWRLATDAFTSLPPNSAVWLVPHVNPDGVEAHRRSNAAQVDLNRNYAYEWSEEEYQPGSGPLSEPETRAIEALTLRGTPVLSVSLHSGAANFGWVWNHTTTPSADEPHHQVLGELYADDCSSPGFWITNGAEWYPTNGDTNDWAYGYWGTFDYTVEVSEEKAPDADKIADHIEHHRLALIRLLTETPTVSGQLVDPQGRPVRGTVTRLPDGQPFHTADDGRFALVEVSSDMRLEATAPGFASVQFRADSQQSVALVPESEASWATVFPPVVVGEDEQSLQVDGAGQALRLWPPGRPAVPVDPGTSSVRLAGLPPGRWGLTSDGQPTTSWLLVDSPDAPAIVDRSLADTTLSFTTTEGGIGREVWTYENGHLIERMEIASDSTHITVELATPDAGRRVDVALMGPGGPVWLADVFGGAWTAVHPPPGTAGLDRGLSSMPGTACGCTSAPVVPVTLLWPVLLGLTRRRHR